MYRPVLISKRGLHNHFQDLDSWVKALGKDQISFHHILLHDDFIKADRQAVSEG